MSDQLTAEHAITDPITPPPRSGAMPRARLHRRVRHGVRHRHNWLQLAQFGAVGASGYALNLVVYEVSRGVFDVHYMLAAVIAFCFAVTNNFLWNRHWTFRATDGHAGFQAMRFLVVSLLALVFNLIVLKVLVTFGMAEFPAQAVAVVCATPFNFLGNKLWSFDR